MTKTNTTIDATAKALTAAKTAVTKARNAAEALATKADEAAARLTDIASKAASGSPDVTAENLAAAEAAARFATLGAEAGAPALAEAEAALAVASKAHATALVEKRLKNAADLDADQIKADFRAELADVWNRFETRFADRNAAIAEAAQTLKAGGHHAAHDSTGGGAELLLSSSGYSVREIPTLFHEGQALVPFEPNIAGQDVAADFKTYVRHGQWI